MNSRRRTNHRDYELLLGEYNILQQKLDSKMEALQIINRELETLRQERDHYKTMIDQLKPSRLTTDRLIGDIPTNIWDVSSLLLDSRRCRGPYDQMLAQHLYELKERDKALQAEVQDLRQKLSDSEGDIKLMREQLSKHRNDNSEEISNSRQFWPNERKSLVEQLEAQKTKYELLEKDLQTVLDEKEELITERDAYKNKVERLNHELNFALKGDEKRIIDVDSILMENRYLQERLRQTQEEKSLYLQTLSKYKNILEKRRNKSSLKFGGNGCGGVIITHKQVEQMLQTTNLSQLPTTQATVADLRSLALALFESLNDKNIALSHQKKANKILGHRLAELEKKITPDSPLNWETPGCVDAFICCSSVNDSVQDAGKSDSSLTVTDKMNCEQLEAFGVLLYSVELLLSIRYLMNWLTDVSCSLLDVEANGCSNNNPETQQIECGLLQRTSNDEELLLDCNVNESLEPPYDPVEKSKNNISFQPITNYIGKCVNGSSMQTSVENGEDDEDKEYMPAELQKLVNDAMEALDRQAKMS